MDSNTKDKNNNLSLKEKKKPKGYARFFRKVIKEKNKSMKNIIQNRFYQWRKDALRGKIKKTVMIRIAVSKEKEPKKRYLLEKPNPKDISKSVNKNDLKGLNINNYPKDINNIKVQNVEKIEKEDKAKEDNKKNNINIKINVNNKNNNGLDDKKNIKDNKDNKEEKNKIYKKVNINKNVENKPIISKKPNNNITNNTNAKPILKQDKIYKHKINITDDEMPKTTPKIKKINPIYSSNTSTLNKKIFQNNNKNLSKDLNNNNNINKVYSSSSKKNDYSNDSFRRNYKISEMPKGIYKKYQGYSEHTSLPVKIVKIDLTEGNKNNNISYNPRTFKRQNNNEYENHRYNNKKIYNNDISHRRDNSNSDNNSVISYNVKSVNYKTETSSAYSRSRKGSNLTYAPSTKKASLKAGLTTVIQHYRGQRKQYDNYDTNSYKGENRKK